MCLVICEVFLSKLLTGMAGKQLIELACLPLLAHPSLQFQLEKLRVKLVVTCEISASETCL
jgi:hypothetical protein